MDDGVGVGAEIEVRRCLGLDVDGGLERRQRFGPRKDQAIGKLGENHQRVVA